MTRDTSIEAYRTIKENGLLSRRRWEVYSLLYELGPTTAGELFTAGVSKKIWKDTVKSTICSRLAELRDDYGCAKETGARRKCNSSGMNVIIWDVTSKVPENKKNKKKSTKTKCPYCKGKGVLEQGRLL